MFTQQAAIILKEWRLMMRSRKAFWLMLGTMLFVSLLFVMNMYTSGESMDLARRNQLGHDLFYQIGVCLIILLGGISAVLTATSVTSERENRTLDILCSSGLSPRQIIWGKWFSSIAYQMLVIVLLMPALAIVFQFGGVGAWDYILTIWTLISTVATYAMLGLNLSVHCKRSLTSLVLTGVIIFFLFTGFPIGITAFFTSPVYSLVGVMIGGSPVAAGMEFILIFFHQITQLTLFAAMAGTAIHSLGVDEKRPHVVAKPVIHDRKILEQRRKRFPYFLFDPLRARDPIADGRDPLYVKEMALVLHGHVTAFIRLCYLTLPVTLMLLFHEVLNESTDGNAGSLIAGSAFLPILFSPFLSATIIAREREQHTLDSLLLIPIGAQRLVWAKFRVVLTLMAIMAACVLTLPLAVQWVRGVLEGLWITVPMGLVVILRLLATLAFYAAIGVWCSSLCKRMTTSLVMTYGLFFAFAMAKLIGYRSLFEFGFFELEDGVHSTMGDGLNFLLVNTVLSGALFVATGGILRVAGGALDRQRDGRE